MNVVELPIEIDQERIEDFCRDRGIRKLSVFGSVLRDDFDPVNSDVDVVLVKNPIAAKMTLYPVSFWIHTNNVGQIEKHILRKVIFRDR